MIEKVAEAFLDEIAKIATAIETAAGHEIHLKAPTMRHIAAIRDPGSAGFIKPKVKMRIAGGARNVGVRRPPTLSSGRSAIGRGQAIRAASGRRPAGTVAATPVP